MSAATNALEDALLNLLLNNVALPFSITSLHLGLSTSNPGETGSPTEPVGNGYARVPITGLFTITGGGVGQAPNSINVEFPQATGSWGTITHAFIATALTGGTVLIFSIIATPTAINVNQVARFVAGGLVVSVA